MSQQKCSTTNPYDGKHCEFVSGHVGWHGYREVALAYMIGVRSQVLEGDFHEACYRAAWKLKDVRAQQEGWMVEAWCSGMKVHQGVERAAEVPMGEERIVEVVE